MKMITCGHCNNKVEEGFIMGGEVFCGYVCYGEMYSLEEGVWM